MNQEYLPMSCIHHFAHSNTRDYTYHVYKQMHKVRERNLAITITEDEALSQVHTQSESYMLLELFGTYTKTDNMVKECKAHRNKIADIEDGFLMQ